MSDRLASGVLVSALLRRVHDAGGSAVVLARGDPQGGAILVVTLERGANPRLLERGIQANGGVGLVAVGPQDASEAEVAGYWRRRRGHDPDLWVIELDIAGAERFAAESIVND